jgi:hypothetical protein
MRTGVVGSTPLPASVQRISSRNGPLHADHAVADLDYNATNKDTLSRSSTTTSTIPPSHRTRTRVFLDSMSTSTLARRSSPSSIPTWSSPTSARPRPSASFVRRTWAESNEQPFGPTNYSRRRGYGTRDRSTCSDRPTFPGISIYNVLGRMQPAGLASAPVYLNIGPNAEGQSSNTGVFQNRIQPSGNAIWTLGKHTVSFGAQLRVHAAQHDRPPHQYRHRCLRRLQRLRAGLRHSRKRAATGFYVSSFLQGNANRYYRANQLGSYVQDKFQVTPHPLSDCRRALRLGRPA